VASTKRNIVDILIYKGKPLQALKLINEVLKVNDLFHDKESKMLTLINRAAIFDNLMKYAAAEMDLREALTIAIELKEDSYQILATSNLGLVTWHLGKTEDALLLLYRVLEMSDEANDGYDVKNTLWIISEIYTSKKQYGQSNEILQKLLNSFEGMDNKRQEAKVLTSLGRNLIELNEIDKAIGYLTKSLDITEDLDAPYEMIENYRNLAYAFAILHNFKAADSLQDLFAETYSVIANSDSTLNSNDKKLTNGEVLGTSSSTSSNWIIAFSLFAILIVLSILAFRRK
jgi:tetratricopeptide (TPR) repeat protein